MAHETPQAKRARERAEAASKIEAAVAARPIGDQARYYDQAVEAVAAQRLKKALRVAERAETRMRRRYQAFNAVADKRPAEPTGLLARFRRQAHRSQLADWQQQYDRAMRLANQAEVTRSAVSGVASHRDARQLAERFLQQQLPKLTERVQAFKAEQARERAEQARERVREQQQRQRELDRSLGKSRGRGMSR